jgi:hypothetical protein
MRMALLRHNIQYKWESHFPLEIGVGLAMGKALHCIVGPVQKPIDTVFGKPVIIASRLGDIAKNNEIYVGQHVADSIKKWAKLEKLPKTHIKGFKGTYPVFKVEGLMDFKLKDKERRDASYIRFVFPEIVALILKDGVRKSAILKNLSPSGAGLEIVHKMDTAISKNDEIKLDLKRFDFPSIGTLRGRIVQIRTISEETDEERCLSRVGIEFNGLDPEKKRVLNRLNIA